MTQDQNKKTLRHFQCRDYLWEIFEQMSAELECSTDYLINEAMRQYARSRNYSTGQGSGGFDNNAVPLAKTNAAPIPSLRSTAMPSAVRPPAPPVPPPRPRRVSSVPNGLSQQRPSAPPPPPSWPTRAVSLPTSAPWSGGAPVGVIGRPPLYLLFNGQKIPIHKDEFVIGRGSKSADLPIRDGNISRRHAAVVFHNGSYFIKDLGSTNGVEFGGRRFESRRIEEGDLYRLCDYEIRFTFQ